MYTSLHFWVPPRLSLISCRWYFLSYVSIKIWYISYNDRQFPSCSDHCCYYYLQQWPARAEKSTELISWGPNYHVLWIRASSLSWKFTRYDHSVQRGLKPTLFIFIPYQTTIFTKTNVPNILQITGCDNFLFPWLPGWVSLGIRLLARTCPNNKTYVLS